MCASLSDLHNSCNEKGAKNNANKQRLRFIGVNSPLCIAGMKTHGSLTYLWRYLKTNRADVLFALIKAVNKEGQCDPVEYMISQGQKPPDKSQHIIQNTRLIFSTVYATLFWRRAGRLFVKMPLGNEY